MDKVQLYAFELDPYDVYATDSLVMAVKVEELLVADTLAKY